MTFSTIARGISVGDELEYADEISLGRSIVNRLPYNEKCNFIKISLHDFCNYSSYNAENTILAALDSVKKKSRREF